MSRPWEETVQEFPALDRNRVYPVIVRDVQKERSPQGIRVTCEFLDEEQRGRIHTQVLPLPIRPAGLTASFLRAAGLAVAVGQKITPRQAIGVVVGLVMAPNDQGAWTMVDVQNLKKKETSDESNA